jgi:hypothetical protein
MGSMRATWKSPSFLALVVLFVLFAIGPGSAALAQSDETAMPRGEVASKRSPSAVALPETTPKAAPGSLDNVMEPLRTGALALAEKNARDNLKKVEVENKKKAQTALATVLAAQAWESDDRYRASRLTGNDVVVLIVVLLLAGSLLALILRYGPQRPKIVDQTVQWVGRVKSEQQDDAFRQTGAALFSLLFLGLSGLVLFGALWLTLHLVADMNKRAEDNPRARAYFDEAKQLITAARDEAAPKVVYEDFDVLTLYSTFLHRVGNDKLSNAVALRALTLRNREKSSPRAKNSTQAN